jgi:hypothetical protein
MHIELHAININIIFSLLKDGLTNAFMFDKSDKSDVHFVHCTAVDLPGSTVQYSRVKK